jgi:hypothetical protein
MSGKGQPMTLNRGLTSRRGMRFCRLVWGIIRLSFANIIISYLVNTCQVLFASSSYPSRRQAGSVEARGVKVGEGLPPPVSLLTLGRTAQALNLRTCRVSQRESRRHSAVSVSRPCASEPRRYACSRDAVTNMGSRTSLRGQGSPRRR